MGQGTLTIYSASAGSGKTFNLAGIYLSRLFRSKYNYRKILAVTFTNKATAEMKGRILDQLHCIATGGQSKYIPGLLKETGKTEKDLRIEAGEILYLILHDFSRFSVSTIDAFFQKVIRAFARECGLQAGFNLELDHSIILSEAIDQMIASSCDDPKLSKWLNEYVLSNLGEEKTWNLKKEITKLAEELFREKFRTLSFEERSRLQDKNFLLEYIDRIRTISTSFINDLKSYGEECLKLFSEYGLTDDMFYHKSNGVPGFIRSISKGKITVPNTYVKKIEADPPKWSAGTEAPHLKKAIEGGLGDAVKEAIRYYERNIKQYNTSIAILSNMYALGILRDIMSKVHEITSSENTFLLSDTGELLALITEGDQAPFIYEKIGNRYENYMIDEFQDTSFLQWKNFNPLIEESMGNGNDNLVVGDIKQSIYRFRNSDWKILGIELASMVNNERFIGVPLKTNWRSRPNIIRFNNSLFSVIPDHIDNSFSEHAPAIKFKTLYSEAVQNDPGKSTGGYVRIEFIDDERDVENVTQGRKKGKVTKRWKDLVLEKLPAIIETFQDKGYQASDIGILVRESGEGAEVLRTMIDYGNNVLPEHGKRYNYNIVSNDSLLLSNSPAIIFIISAIRVLDDPEDMINRARMIRFLMMARGKDNPEKFPLYRERLIEGQDGFLPAGYENFLEKARQMPFFESVENIISYFELGKYPWNVSYLNTFQDQVMSFAANKQDDRGSFLEWWDTTGSSKSVVLPANQNAAKVLTIHKCKGLEFKAVIIPFLSWNLDHKSVHHPVLWIRPGVSPFNELGIVPVRYEKALAETVFANDYLQEKYSACLDNINLLYVAMTRAKNAIWGFAPEFPGPNNGIAATIRDALISDENPAGNAGIVLSSMYDSRSRVFEFGTIPDLKEHSAIPKDIILRNYSVSPAPDSLKLKLHSENYFATGNVAAVQKVNYGKIMHEVFEALDTPADIPSAVHRLVLDGKIEESESDSLVSRLSSLISSPLVSEWFKPGTKVMIESDILLPSGITRRPDRVIIKDRKAVIVDFKFGVEERHHTFQINEYRDLLSEMGCSEIESYLWYVDQNKIVRVQ